MTDGGVPERDRAARPALAGPLVTTMAVAVAVVVLVLATWAATVGPDDPLRGAGPGVDPAETARTSQVATEPPTQEEQERAEDHDGTPWLVVVMVVVLLAVVGLLALAALGLLVAALWSLRRVRRHPRDPAHEPPTPLEPAAAVAVAIADDAVAQLELLADGTPRNGIVQCWHRFEVQAARAGVPRHGWETSAEFTMRLLDLVRADDTAVSRLAVLYREARFSDHEVGEDARAAAADIVRRVHRDLHTLLGGGVR